MKTVEIKVEGMTCNGCVNSVTRVLEAIDGVSRAQVSLSAAQATAQFDENLTNNQLLKKQKPYVKSISYGFCFLII